MPLIPEIKTVTFNNYTERNNKPDEILSFVFIRIKHRLNKTEKNVLPTCPT
jgi:hypothetical protein